MAKKKDLRSPENFINRELSWLEFNDRVLREGLSPAVPLLERLKFFAIVSSNLDEFYMVRVAGLMQQRAAGLRRRDPAGMTPRQQLAAIAERAHRMLEEQNAGIREVLDALADHGLHVLDAADWTPEQRQFLRSFFANEVQPVLTPMAVEELDPIPLLPGLRLHVALLVRYDSPEGEASPKIVVLPVPTQLNQFVTIPAENGIHLARLGEVVTENAGRTLKGAEVLSTALFRITRDGDSPVQDDDAADLLQAMEEAVLSRRRRAAVRLEISAHADPRIKAWLVGWLQLTPDDVFETDSALDAGALFEVVNRRGFDKLRDPEWPPQPSRDLHDNEDLWSVLADRDLMLIHPYESFEPVVRMVELAAEDGGVLAIKMVLYRTSGDSPIIRALEHAAQNGKQVTVLVELKARFDEARNINWARQLEDAGCNVIYGIAGYKTHAKALLVVRREGTRVRRYVHLATGNYNDRTARLYSDVGMMTANRDLGRDVAAFFNLLTGYSEAVEWSQLTIAPTGLRQRFLDLIDREAQLSTPDEPGLIMAKLNSLQDREIIEALYRASGAGVQIRLNVRGICCLRPGVKRLSRTIEVISVVDRYLEHARVFYFQNGGHDEVYLSSADWMTRNLDKRLELLFPVRDPNLKRRMRKFLSRFFADNVKSHKLAADGSWVQTTSDKSPYRAQEKLHSAAVSEVRAARQTPVRFRPITAPKS
jgi:polyphosphate kinase